MASNLRTFALHSCEEWNAIFARLKAKILLADYQVFTIQWINKMLYLIAMPVCCLN